MNIGLGSKKWHLALIALACLAAGAALLIIFGDVLLRKDWISLGSDGAGVAPHDDDVRKTMSSDAAETASRSSNFSAGFAPAAIYDPVRPLGEQLPALRRYAQAGNSYAICILAMALDSCMQEMTQSDDSRWDELAADDLIEQGGENDVRSLSEEIDRRKARAFMCADVSSSDRLERDKWMQLSAKNGDPRAMALYARNPVATANIRLSEIDRLADFSKNAEAMLNRAAVAGVPEAIVGVYIAYSSGEIETPVGEVEVEKDAAKAVGAGMAMLEFAHEAEKADIQRRIDELLAGMDAATRARMSGIRKVYAHAYRSQAADGNPSVRQVAGAPDAACMSIRGGAKAVVARARG